MQLVSPRVGFSIMKTAIEKTLKTEIENFDVIYRHAEKVIDFRLYNYTDYSENPPKFHDKIVMKYGDSEKLVALIYNELKGRAKKDDEIIAAVANYKDKTCKLLVKRDGQKQTITFTL